MKHIRLISTFLNPNRSSQTSTHLHFSAFLKSKNVSFSTFASPHTFPHQSPSNRSWSRTSLAYQSTSSNPADTKQEMKFIPTERVSAIVDEISGLTILECQDLFETLKEKLDIKEVPQMVVMMPGMGFSGKGGAKGGGGSKEEEKKVEKIAFDLKLEGFDAASKIKIIKEVRTFTDLGLKEAKDLVEKAPTLLKKGVAKEEAEKIIEKMKAIGAKVVME